jgi:hypothetical protein
MKRNTTEKHNAPFPLLFLSEDATFMNQYAVATVILAYIGDRRGPYQHG